MHTLVVDSNALRHPALEKFLQASRDHAIAFSDLTLMEMRKRNALKTSRASLAIASRYPEQVFLLKPTSDLLDHDVRNEKDQPNLIDYQGTIDFRELCKDLTRVPVPDYLEQYMRDQESEAGDFIRRLQEQVTEWEPALLEACSAFSPSEIASIAQGKATAAISPKIANLLKETIKEFMTNNGLVPPSRSATLVDLLGTLSFRYPLCVMVFYLLWVQSGRTTGKRLDRRTNDVIDLQIAAAGSYFDGVLSGDDLVKDVSAIAREVMRSYGAFVPPDWRPSAALQSVFRGDVGR